MRRLGAMEERMLALVVRRDAGGPLSAATLQRALGILFVAGATIGTVSMAFPQPPGTNEAGLFGIYGIAYVVGAVLLAGKGRLPPWSSHVGLAIGSLLVTLAVSFTDERTSVYPMFYV